MREWTDENQSSFDVMDRDTVRRFDAWAIQQMGIPGTVLMENAACGCLSVIERYFHEAMSAGVCIFCGTGNNGGDGFVIARHLHNRNIPVQLVIGGDPKRIGSDAKVNYDICVKMNLPIQVVEPDSPDMSPIVTQAVSGCGLIVDALFGTGLSGPLKGPAALLIHTLNSLDVPIIAVDIPSGMECDTGQSSGGCITAAATVTFAAVKRGFVENPLSRQATGRLFVAEIGITPASGFEF